MKRGPIGLIAALALVLGCDNAPSSTPKSPARQPLAWSASEASQDEGGQDEGAHADGHERMVGLLRAIADRTEFENPYLGRSEIVRLQKELATRLRDGEFPLPSHVSLLVALGFHRLRVGENSEALRDLDAAYGLWKSKPAEVPGAIVDRLLLVMSIAHLRVAETENCIWCETGQSCIFPITAETIHDHRSGSQQAQVYLRELLGRNPKDLGARWLLNLTAMTLGQHPEGLPSELVIPRGAFDSPERFPRFVNRSIELGLATMSSSGGTIVDDFDGDDLLDIVFSDSDPQGQLRLFQNDGAGGFFDATEKAGLMGITGGLNILQADYDNDGRLDILVLRGAWLGKVGRHPNSLLRNVGGGKFKDVTFQAGLGEAHYPTQTAAWADFDLDGDLDLYVGNERHPCQLFRNDGAGNFHDIAASAGVENHQYTKGVVWGDYDSDGDPDLYVSNLGAENRLYQNQGGGRFVDVAAAIGVQKPIASFPTFFWDVNNDGRLDLSAFSYNADIADIAADYLDLPVQAEQDAHYLNEVHKDSGGFRHATKELGLDRVTHPMGANFGDLDNDGYLDFYLGTGDIPFQTLMPNLAFRNQTGERFADITEATGLGHLQKGHGVAFADLDRDGDQDLVLELGGAFSADRFRNAVFENTMPREQHHHWLALKLVGATSNRSAIGTRVHAIIEEDGRERSIYRWVSSGGSFGANPLRITIGLARAVMVKRLEVDWPASGVRQQFSDISAGQLLEIHEDQESYQALFWAPPQQP